MRHFSHFEWFFSRVLYFTGNGFKKSNQKVIVYVNFELNITAFTLPGYQTSSLTMTAGQLPAKFHYYDALVFSHKSGNIRNILVDRSAG
jgi:hypothetical protein